MIEQWILGFLIAIYVLLVILLVVVGVKRMKNSKKNDTVYTSYQRSKMLEAKNNPKRYEQLRRYYTAINGCKVRGRVLSMKGEVLHPGFEVIKGERREEK